MWKGHKSSCLEDDLTMRILLSSPILVEYLQELDIFSGTKQQTSWTTGKVGFFSTFFGGFLYGCYHDIHHREKPSFGIFLELFPINPRSELSNNSLFKDILPHGSLLDPRNRSKMLAAQEADPNPGFASKVVRCSKVAKDHYPVDLHERTFCDVPQQNGVLFCFLFVAFFGLFGLFGKRILLYQYNSYMT